MINISYTPTTVEDRKAGGPVMDTTNIPGRHWSRPPTCRTILTKVDST